MASDVGIANRALSRLGQTRITSLTENTVAAREINAVFADLREAELRAHNWHFAIKRASLAADGTAPSFGPANAFTLPSDYLKLIPPAKWTQDNALDWLIEGQKILTGYSAPLNIRYVWKVTDPNVMDPLFREAFAMKLAEAVCEKLTQSNTKIQLVRQDYDDAIARARKANAFEVPSEEPPEDTWITARA